jgi:hypothetical protein
MKILIALLTVLVLMSGTVFAYWGYEKIEIIMTAPAQPNLQTADSWCEEAVRNSWKWQNASAWCNASAVLLMQDPCKTVLRADLAVASCQLEPNCLAKCKKAVAKSAHGKDSDVEI